jgi:hypothetical protein
MGPWALVTLVWIPDLEYWVPCSGFRIYLYFPSQHSTLRCCDGEVGSNGAMRHIFRDARAMRPFIHDKWFLGSSFQDLGV